jgi:hypothetical protein
MIKQLPTTLCACASLLVSILLKISNEDNFTRANINLTKVFNHLY